MRGLRDTAKGWGVDEDGAAEETVRPVMGIAQAAARLGISEQSVRRWIDDNEPDAEHPDRVPVAERPRVESGPEARRWRRPYRDAVEAEAGRRQVPWPSEQGPTATPPE
jgi:transposase